MLGAIVAGTSIDRVTGERSRCGENFDTLFGNPFVPAASDIVTPIIGDPAARNVTAATTGSLTIEGEDITVTAFERARGSYAPVITAGRAPATDQEIALGRRVARSLDRGVGDVVSVVGATGESAELDVVGITVPATAQQ